MLLRERERERKYFFSHYLQVFTSIFIVFHRSQSSKKAENAFIRSLNEKLSLISRLVCIIRFIARLEEPRMSASMIHLFIKP